MRCGGAILREGRGWACVLLWVIFWEPPGGSVDRWWWWWCSWQRPPLSHGGQQLSQEKRKQRYFCEALRLTAKARGWRAPGEENAALGEREALL